LSATAQEYRTAGKTKKSWFVGVARTETYWHRVSLPDTHRGKGHDIHPKQSKKPYNLEKRGGGLSGGEKGARGGVDVVFR